MGCYSTLHGVDVSGMSICIFSLLEDPWLGWAGLKRDGSVNFTNTDNAYTYMYGFL